MQITHTVIPTDFKGGFCFVHARCAIREDGSGIMTAQPLRLTGSDIFYGMYFSRTADGGHTWSPLTPSKTLTRRDLDDGTQIALCDATPMFHRETGKFLLLGHSVVYLNDEIAPSPCPRYTIYSTFDEKMGDFTPPKVLTMPEGDRYFSCGNGSGQSLETENGDLLIPVYHMDKTTAADPWNGCYSASVMHCSFDGEEIRLRGMGNDLTVDIPRGLCEPSLVRFGGRYFLALRNDESGYVSRGTDGLHYEPPRELAFDDGANAGNYCTQQHWLTGGDRLYLVYTRRGADNDHVFRHRAPLFIAEFDTERMCLIRETEHIAVPNRGARLGNFGCQSMSDGRHGIVCAAEWMQTTAPDPFDWRKCMSYGSDNSIFVAHIDF